MDCEKLGVLRISSKWARLVSICDRSEPLFRKRHAKGHIDKGSDVFDGLTIERQR